MEQRRQQMQQNQAQQRYPIENAFYYAEVNLSHTAYIL